MYGRANLASAIFVDPDSVTRWCTGAEPVPPTWCPAIERASGVRCEDLAPAVSWERDDLGEVTGLRLPARPSAEARASAA
jgi:DNA-binding transcriptional regulator YdaS (Cro superfamily)